MAVGSVIKNVILQRKGEQYLDTKTDTVRFLYNATVIVADYEPERHVWTVSTVYRDPSTETKRRGTRYRKTDVDKVVETGQLLEP